MPNKRLSVNKTREILRLHFEFGLSERKIATSCGVARSTVANYLSLAAEASLSWPLPEDLDDEEILERLLFASQPKPRPKRPLPDWDHIRKELTKPGVTLLLLWEDYRQEHDDGYSRSRFFELYSLWNGQIDPVMRVQHKAGDKLFVDYAGQTMTVVDPKTGEERYAEIFVAALGVELHVCRGDLDAESSRLDWRSRSGVFLHRRGYPSACSRICVAAHIPRVANADLYVNRPGC